MQRLALLAILPWLVPGCTPSPPRSNGPDGSSSSGDVDSSVTNGGPIGDGGAGAAVGDGGAGGAASDGTASSGPPIPCDSGGPLVLKSAWPLPAVNTDEGIATTVDPQGNVYVTGTFNGSVMFGSTTLTAPTAAGTSNMFLVKYDGGGNVLLAKSWGTATGIYLPPAIAVDSAGNVFLGGAFANALDFGGSSTALDAVSYLDGFAVKISPTGDAVWAVRFGYDDGAAVLSIAMAPDGNPIVAGSAYGAIVLGSTMWSAAGQSTEQPFIAKLSTTDGTVLWGNATGGDIVSGEDIFVSTDSAGRVFVAARVESGGGAWGGSSDGGNFSALRAGFEADGSILWGQVDYGAFPTAAAVDHAGRFWVLEDGQDTVTLSGTSTAFGDAQSGIESVSMLFSPVDGTLLSGLDIGDTFPNAGAVDGHGNSFVSGTYWPSLSSPRPVGNLSLPAGSEAVQPFFLAALDGLSHAVSVMTLPVADIVQPYAMTMDPGSGNVFVLASLGSASTPDSSAAQPGLVVAVFGPDPCDDGTGPPGPSTGTPGNHGVLSPDGGSPYVTPDAVAPAACPASTDEAVNGAACPVAMGCSYGTTCCLCAPTSCNGEPTLWTCDAIQNDAACPSVPPAPGTACPSTTLKCNYCDAGGRLYANCNAGGWSTGYAQILCE
jgi:hypothetical protein